MNFDDMMKELRTEYLDSLPAKLRDLEKSLSQEDVDCLREDFHKLKGTGKTYGFPEISELGEVVERLLIQKPHSYAEVIPNAIGILRDIHRERSASRDFDLSEDGRFRSIRSLNL
ncbi:MAG: Hpt domain-containing protein [Bdellovibrionaceae bacterium]|nr:Hpt domain-containing protein [Bdellovibrionales bacterium]MCB9084518.1 Hpt domain-containing protein [Pseudobdellovibrionaceae bacterium]